MLVHMDNFSIYGTDTAYMLNGVYAEILGSALAVDPDGISAGHVFYVGGGSGFANDMQGLRFVLPENSTRVGMAGRIWFPALPSGSNGQPTPFIWRNGANAPIASLTVDSTGRMIFHIGDYNGSSPGETVNPVITANGWYHIEAWLDTVADTFELRVEGVPVLEISALAISATVSQVFVGTRSTASSAVRNYFWKDFVVCNGEGTYNNDFIGSVLVANLAPTADIALNWTPSTGSVGYSILDNVPPVDAQYLSAGNPPPSAYVCEMSDLPIDVTTVKAIMTFVRAAKTDGGDASLQVGVISDGDTGLGDNRPITIAQTYWRDVHETDPATAVPWLPAAVNAVNLQLNRTG